MITLGATACSAPFEMMCLKKLTLFSEYTKILPILLQSIDWVEVSDIMYRASISPHLEYGIAPVAQLDRAAVF